MLDKAECLAYAGSGGRTGGNGAGARPAQPVTYRDVPGGHVGDHHRYEERRNAARPLFRELARLGFYRLEAADSGADIYAEVCQINAAKVEARILYAQLRRRDGELAEAVVPPRLLALHIKLGVKVLYLAGEAHLIVRSVKSLDRRNAAFSGLRRREKLLRARSYGGNGPHARYYYSIIHYDSFQDVGANCVRPCNNKPVGGGVPDAPQSFAHGTPRGRPLRYWVVHLGSRAITNRPYIVRPPSIANVCPVIYAAASDSK